MELSELSSQTDRKSQITAGEVVNFYKVSAKKSLNENALRMISLYPIWKRTKLTPDEVGRLDWYLDKNPNHISYDLTKAGKHRKVFDVAKEYLSNKEIYSNKWGEGIRRIEEIIKSLERGENLTPIITIPGDRYPDSPDSSFIDGVHRALAFMVYSIQSRQAKSTLDSFVGAKDRIVKRTLRKASRLLGLPPL